MDIISTIIPIFIIIFLGIFARHKGFLSQDFLHQANRLVYYIAIPAMIFSAIAKSSLKTQFHPGVILITLTTVCLIVPVAWLTARLVNIAPSSKGSFIHSAFHGNLGYIGLAVAFYYLGHAGFVKAAIIAGFVMILQNVMAVAVLQFYSRAAGSSSSTNLTSTLGSAMTNPVILSALAGIVYSLLGMPLPVILDRSLTILKGMALPMALLVIGASLSFEKIRLVFSSVAMASVLKLLVMPAMGFVLFTLFGISASDFIPGLIILAAPTATLVFIMAEQIGGDPDLGVAAISISTLVSGLTYGIWLSVG
ncbi:AEC family transporter [Desulfobacter hydrogenophilus]|uniref:AEC family transporter n=1 Tax=Desulfobacter hydrogenophilus TaxID=2291 RepID=A0A328FFC4_9BACT|nr:AEC family transporter [Desulfobacter hydrogenophilus]NDY71503.1 AEC family transporter [Desulfobacter hydrogenophilus]QBH11887.1 AEC family transporter [Desulfobacter hydrogenophilus]RAM02530.1 AEC family transporter [Desulfobacter hydrogenophilus]